MTTKRTYPNIKSNQVTQEARKFSSTTVSRDEEHCLLVIDDDAIVLNALKNFLKRRVSVVYTAKTSEEARAILNNYRINIVICDYDLGTSEVNGVELIRQLRRQFPKIRRVAIYSGMDTRDIKKTKEIDIICNKPADLQDLCTLVQRPFTD